MKNTVEKHEENDDILSYQKCIQCAGEMWKCPFDNESLHRSFVCFVAFFLGGEEQRSKLYHGTRSRTLEPQWAVCCVQSLYPGMMNNARGLGTLCAVDFPTTDVRNSVVIALRNRGTFEEKRALELGTFHRAVKSVDNYLMSAAWEEFEEPVNLFGSPARPVRLPLRFLGADPYGTGTAVAFNDPTLDNGRSTKSRMREEKAPVWSVSNWDGIKLFLA